VAANTDARPNATWAIFIPRRCDLFLDEEALVARPAQAMVPLSRRDREETEGIGGDRRRHLHTEISARSRSDEVRGR